MKKLVIEVVSKKAPSINDKVDPAKRDNEKAESEAKKAAKKEAARVATLAHFATNLMISTVKQTANYFISDIGRRHGDSNYQAQINRSFEIAKDGFGLVGAAVSGAALAGQVGAVLGLAAGAINLGFKYAERERGYQHEMFKDSNSQAYNLARANYSALTGRLR